MFETFVDNENLDKIIKNEYIADMEAVQNLSIISKKLQKENVLIIPSDLIILGKLKIPSQGTLYERVNENQIKKVNLNNFVNDKDKILVETNNGYIKPVLDSQSGRYYISNKYYQKNIPTKIAIHKIEKVPEDQLTSLDAPKTGC